MGALLGLAAAIAYGVSDFAGGIASRRAHFLLVALVGQAMAVVVTCSALAVYPGSGPSAQALGWGAVSGVGVTIGTLALYRGYGHGEMAVTGPLSAVGAALLPAVFGIATGDALSPVVAVGMVAALPAIYLMARSDEGSHGSVRRGVVDGVVSGAGFAVLFIALGLAGDDAGLWPVAASEVASVVTLAASAAATRLALRSMGATAAWQSLAAGVLGAAATICYFRAAHTSLLSVAAVLTSVYPGVTVALAAAFLRERPSRVQTAGLVVGAAAVAAIVLG